MKRRRVKITGIGPVTPAGIGREDFWRGILSGQSFIRPYRKLGEEAGAFCAAYINVPDIKTNLGGFDVPKGTSRQALLAAVGARLALTDAGLIVGQISTKNCGIVIGSSLLDFGGIGSAIDSVNKRGPRAAQARVVYTATLTSVSEIVARVCGVEGKSLSVQTSCCAGMDAIGQAFRMVSSGEIDIAICGGTEAPLHKFPMLELRAAGLTPLSSEMSDRIARPFDLWRTTGVVSEGACILVLEPEESPRPGYAFVAGYGTANDQPDDLCSGLVDSANSAFADAFIRPMQIDVINAWGPGHRLIDEAEAKSMKNVFGARLPGVAAFSLKGAVGSALGAAPAIQVGASALALASGVIPGTVNWQFPDPSCPLNISGRVREIQHRFDLVNAHGVGNVNASIVLQQCS
ncbi:MAG: hypothetical protein B9S34_07155 [Opitutia bacterium Tous-C1TDCM]|nr:MAG: hypothetical protein B9S34_07155 [Opitutae bacterium Tous-C1TDCM]